MLLFPAPDIPLTDRSKQVQQKIHNFLSCGAAELWPSCWKGNVSRGVSFSCRNTSNLQPLFIALLPCLLLNILLLGGMMLSKQCGLLENSQAVVLLITSQLSLIFSPSTFKHFLCLLIHLSTHAAAERAPQTLPNWGVTVREELAFPIALQQGSPGQFQTQSIACSDKIISEATGKSTQTSSILLTTQLPQTARNLQPKLTTPFWNMQGKINSSGKKTPLPWRKHKK